MNKFLKILILVLCVLIGCFAALQEDYKQIFGAMDGIQTYLSVMASISFAVIALLSQNQILKAETRTATKHALENIIFNMKIEIFRIVFMVMPILALTLFSVFNVQTSLCAGILVTLTMWSICISIQLPLRYLVLIKKQVEIKLYEIEEEERIAQQKNIDNLLPKKNC